MTEEERDDKQWRLAKKARTARVRAAKTLGKQSSREVCSRCRNKFLQYEEYPPHVLMGMIVNPEGAVLEGCSMFREFEDDR